MNDNFDLNSILTEDESRIKAIFDPTYQIKFIKCFLEDNEFYEQIMDIIATEYFDEYQRILIDRILKYIEKYGVRPTYHDIKTLIKKTEKRQSNIDYLLGLVEKVEQVEVRSRQDIIDTSYIYFKKKALANGIKKAVSSWNRNNFDGISLPIEEALRAGEPKDSGHDYVKDVEKRLVEDYRSPIPCMPGLDHKIGGGLSSGELGVVMAPTGGGKSMFLVALAANAFKRGLKVMYYTLELSDKAVGQRFDACLNNLAIKDVTRKEYQNKVRKRAVELDRLGGALKIKKYNSRSASVHTIKSHLSTIKRNENFIPDIVFIDYADIMKPLETSSEHRHTLQILYQQIRSIAEEFEVPIWSATQTNRCCHIATKVLIDGEIREMGSLKEGESILTHEGYKKITHVFPVEKQPGYKIRLKNGKEIIVSAKHMFPTPDKGLISIETGLSVGDRLYSKKSE